MNVKGNLSCASRPFEISDSPNYSFIQLARDMYLLLFATVASWFFRGLGFSNKSAAFILIVESLPPFSQRMPSECKPDVYQ